jgi:hypothetical protein
MSDLCRLIWCALIGIFRPRAALQAEILVLRHQLNVLRRKSPRRLAVGNVDRLVFAALYRVAPGVLDALKILKPQTVIRWHRAGFRAYWRWKSRPSGGRPKAAADIRKLIRDMSIANPLWGAPRIHGELLKLGIDVGQTTVAKYMARRRRPPSQGWKTFLRNHADGIASMDLFVVPTISSGDICIETARVHHAARRRLGDWRTAMRNAFVGYFRPTSDEFYSLWKESVFAVDANVVLHLYRYSLATQRQLEEALSTVKDKLFIPHQAAKEFLRRRLSVIAGQANEYEQACRDLKKIHDKVATRKRHPFLDGEELDALNDLIPKLVTQLESRRDGLMARLSEDKILEFVSTLFDGRVGAHLTDDEMKALSIVGEERYKKKIPPGYQDADKEPDEDPYRKYGDFIIWKQLIAKAQELARPPIFVTDDKSEDWWLEQSGRKVGRRPELREEFVREAGQHFWMYTPDRFVEEAGRRSETEVSNEAIAKAVAEIVEVREEEKIEEKAVQESSVPRKYRFEVISEEEILEELRDFLEEHPSDDGSVGLKYFVVRYLGSMNYEIGHSYGRINSLINQGLIDCFSRERDGITSTRIKLSQKQLASPREGK